MHHLFIINPKSFTSAQKWRDFLLSVENTFSKSNRAEYSTYLSRYPRDGIAAVHRYIDKLDPGETARVYAVGGDGILFDCLNGIIDYPTAELASIPYGNANDFVRAFGEGKHALFRDVALMSRAPTIKTDVIRSDTNYGLMHTTFGIESAAVMNMTPASNRLSRFKLLRRFVPTLYRLGAVLAIMDSETLAQHYEIEIDGVDYSGEYVDIMLGNTLGNGGTNVTNPHAAPNDGLLDAVMLRNVGRVKTLSLINSYVHGGFEQHGDKFAYVKFRRLHIKSNKTMFVGIDGENFFSEDIELEVIPKAVNIVAPPGMRYINDSEGSIQP
jgi:diacylglycerol kinase (ATP)